MVDEGVPGLVGVCEGWLRGEVVADFGGLGSAVAQIIDLLADAMVLGLELVVSVFELVVAAVVIVGVVDGGRCGGDELIHQHDGFFQPLPLAWPAGFQSAGAQPLVDMASMTMLGRPIVLSPSMPNAEPGSIPVAFLNPKSLRMIEPDHPALRVI